MTLNGMRGVLYGLARLLGDVQAVRRGPRAIGKRLVRKAMGRAFGRLLRRI